MNVLVYIEVSDRREIEGVPGLHVHLLLKRDGGCKTHALVGAVEINSARQIDAIQIRLNEIWLDEAVAARLVGAACEACWQAVVVNDAVMAGFKWRPLNLWLAEHVEAELLRRIVHDIELSISLHL